MSTSEHVIRKLDESTINRIAAGEVIVRPANALKELLENALDAKATRVVVTAKEGGLKQLIIQDNGTGINYADLPILAERHTTSKITSFRDLHTSLTTFGFRGEALASISHASHLSVITKINGQSHGWKAAYQDGKMIPLKPGDSADPRPTAANDGTVLTVDDLFFNMPSRKKALKSPAEEYNRLLEVVCKYAIHNSGIAMVCKKHSSKNSDVATTADASIKDNIGIIYNDAIKQDLLEFSIPDNEEFGFSLKGWMTGSTYSGKKGIYLFFINNRLVDCTPLRKAIEAFYTSLLPKGGLPFVYLSLKIVPDRIDVNVHPTKSEVLFENQDEIVQLLIEAMGDVLAQQSTTRNFDSVKSVSNVSFFNPLPSTSTSSNSKSKPPPQKLVRTDANARTLQEMFGFESTQSAQRSNTTPVNGKQVETIDLTQDGPLNKEPFLPQMTRPKMKATRSTIKLSHCSLSSVRNLREAIDTSRHEEMTQILAEHAFVGLIGPDKPLSAIQHGIGLYLINHDRFAEELFYQLALRQFGKIGRLDLEPPPNIRELLEIAAFDPLPGLDLPIEIEELAELWMAKREMLEEYFNLVITEDGLLKALPLLLPGYEPVFDRLPLFLVQGARQTNWLAEQECFDTFSRQLAKFYVPAALFRPNTDQQQHQIQHILFPALKQYLIAPETLADRQIIIQMASLDKLYRVFERC